MTCSFAIDPGCVEILSTPEEFYARSMSLIDSARERVSLASLYIGEGEKSLRMIEALRSKAEKVPVVLLLDKNRSTRKGSPKIMCPNDPPNLLSVNLYSSPLQDRWGKFLPERVREVVSVQHMKALVVDEYVLITGANFSDSYFENRQDRYMVVRDRDLADYVACILDDCGRSPMQKHEILDTEDKTVITVGVQAGFINNQGGENLLKWIISQGSDQIYIASGYLYLPESTENFLATNPRVKLLTAAPSANSFFRSPGFSRFIPDMYGSYLERVEKKFPGWDIYTYKRPGWTFHAKGVWLNGSNEWATVIGSSNFTYRSRDRDLELSFLLRTRDENLKLKLNDEVKRLFNCERWSGCSPVSGSIKILTSCIFKYWLYNGCVFLKNSVCYK